MTGPTRGTPRPGKQEGAKLDDLHATLPYHAINLEPLGFYARSLGLDLSLSLGDHRSEHEFIEAAYANLVTAELLEPDVSDERLSALGERMDKALRLVKNQTANVSFQRVSLLAVECEATRSVAAIDGCPFVAVPCDGGAYRAAVDAVVDGDWTPVLLTQPREPGGPTAVLVYCFGAPTLKVAQ